MNPPDLADSLESMSGSYLIFDFSETNGIIEGLSQCNVALWDSNAFERMRLHLWNYSKLELKLLKMISKLSLLTPKEFDQLTNPWNQTQHEHSETLCAHEIFESIVVKTPEAIVAILENEVLTYENLNIQANQLASLVSGKN